MGENGTMKTRKPQLADSIARLDDMVDGLATAIPGAVADSVREALGAAFAEQLKAAVRDAVGEAVGDGVREAMSRTARNPTANPTPPGPPPPPAPRVRAWGRVKALLGRLGRWATRRAAAVAARLAVGWAAVRLVGGATARSRAATVSTALAGVAAGLAGYAAGPAASAVLLGLAGGAGTAVAVWAGPLVGLLAAFRDDRPGGA